MDTRLKGFGLMGSLALALCACGPADDSEYDIEGEIGFRSDDGGRLVITPPRPGDGGAIWLSNGLESPNVSGVDPAFGLSTPAGMATSFGLLDDPALRHTAEYLVECALPYGSSITKVVDGQTLVLDGLVGLAPEWEDGECDQDCQEWVSACLLARTNTSGNAVTIWIQAEHEAVGYGLPAGAKLEAAFFGNLFADPEDRYLCKGSGLSVVEAHREGRTCSFGSGGECGFTIYSNCTNHSRCELAGSSQDVPRNCKVGSQATSEPLHTIAAYIVP